jgi:hypothetical protein
MKLARSLLIGAAFALAAGCTDDKPKSGRVADKNSDGYLTRAEARGNPHLASNFKATDRNHDGRLNRAEYRAVVTKNDVKTAKTKGAVHRKPSARAGESAVWSP